MTRFHYRGFPYTPTQTMTERTPKPLMYRGVAHVGTAQTPPHRSGTMMIYRGVAFLRAASGQIVTLGDAAPGAVGQPAVQ